MRVRCKFSERVPVVVEFTEPTKCQTHLVAECNINAIIARHTRAGLYTGPEGMNFGDASIFENYAQNLDRVRKAQESFEALPSKVRSQFGNSIPDFFEYLQNPANKDELIRLGVLDKPQAAPSTAAPPTPPAPIEPPK